MHLEGHFLGDPLIEMGRKPIKKIKDLGGPLIKSVLNPTGGKLKDRTGAIQTIGSVMVEHMRPSVLNKMDPVRILKEKLSLPKQDIHAIESEIKEEIDTAVARATA